MAMHHDVRRCPAFRLPLAPVTQTPALIIAAAGVGFGHAILPDHWLPLAVVGRTQHYPLARVARLSGLAGVTHVLVSLVLGAIIIAIGLQFRSRVEGAQNAIVGGLLIATGLVLAILELTGHGHSHSDEGHSHAGHEHAGHAHAGHAHAGHEHAGNAHAGHAHAGQDHRGWRSQLAVMVPFGAAASPDLTILPVFLAATTAGAGAAVGSLIAFATVTIATIVTLTLIATAGGYQIGGRWLDRWGNALTAIVLVVIGGLVLTGVV